MISGRTRARAFAIGLPTAVLAVGIWDPARHGGPPLCPWRAATGVACPGCGLTRAAGALLHGRGDEALHLHPLVLVVGLQLAALWALAIRAGFGGSTVSPRTPPSWVMPVLLTANAVMFFAVWGVRFVDDTLPAA